MYIKDIDDKIKELMELKYFLKINTVDVNDTVETIIYKKYIELENVSKVTDYINGLGYRIETSGSKQGKTERKYTSNDISSIITNKNVNVEKKLKIFTVKLFKHHKGRIKV